MDKPLKSVMHSQCDARLTVTFPVAGRRCLATGTKLYCLVTEAHVCEQLAQQLDSEMAEVELATSRVASQRHNHYTTRPHTKRYGSFILQNARSVRCRRLILSRIRARVVKYLKYK